MMFLYPNFNFTVKHNTCSGGRVGLITTPHGNINTPAFIFCATRATIKNLTPEQLLACNTQIILANTYHLLIQPGSDVVKTCGGLHKFMSWNKPMLTDSGGFQIFSLGHGGVAQEIKGHLQKRSKTLIKITEDGAWFRSYLDGKIHLLTPEYSIKIQQDLGADLIVVLDECTPFHVHKDYTEQSMHLSHRWSTRCVNEFIKNNTHKQALYGVVQGGVYQDLRYLSANYINQLPLFGSAIGGSLGSTKQEMSAVLQHVTPLLTKERPIHLLGIGGISDIFAAVKLGIDTFDCVHPTRIARHGSALITPNHRYFSNKEQISLFNSKFKLDQLPIDPECECFTCRNFSCAYLHHLFKAKELLGMQALTIHNVMFMNNLMSDIQKALLTDNLEEAQRKWCKIIK